MYYEDHFDQIKINLNQWFRERFFSILICGGHFVQRSKAFEEILVEGIMVKVL